MIRTRPGSEEKEMKRGRKKERKREREKEIEKKRIEYIMSK